MGTKGKEIIKDAERIVGLLNRALADEWLAYYQYWVGSKVAKGPLRPNVTAELAEHAGEELEHANMLAERIIQLGGTPLVSPVEIEKHKNCDYEAPSDPHTVRLLEQNIKGEQCAIEVYNKLLHEIKGAGDYITFNMVRKILEDEVKHEEDLQSLLEDIGLSK